MALTKAIVLMKLRVDMLLGPNTLGWRDRALHWLINIKMEGEDMKSEMQYVPLHYI